MGELELLKKGEILTLPVELAFPESREELMFLASSEHTLSARTR